MLNDVRAACDRLRQVAADPRGYVTQWKQVHGGRAIGVFPMNFPQELVAAAGLLPVIVQQADDPITVGNRFLTEFHCGYTRSLADQAGRGAFDVYDAFVLADHCIQLFGAADVVREFHPEKPMLFSQLISAMGDRWTGAKVQATVQSFRSDLEAFAGRAITDQDLRQAIALANENRGLLRRIFAARREGRCTLSASDMQVMVKSSMIMDRAEHSALLRTILPAAILPVPREDHVRLHLSGHFCHPPKPALLDLIESVGGIVVDDDLYVGMRYIATDVPDHDDPAQALVGWYLDRNRTIPCPTRVQNDVDWDGYLLNAVERAGAEAVVVLMAKFCEPHMLYYPELKRALEARGVPHLLIETEHEGVPAESIRTRLEALFERIRRTRRSHHTETKEALT